MLEYEVREVCKCVQVHVCADYVEHGLENVFCKKPLANILDLWAIQSLLQAFSSAVVVWKQT